MPSRVLEPEVMDTAEEARDYDAMDHGEVNRAFVAALLQRASAGAGAGVDLRRILDVGTGTALIAIELCRRAPSAEVVAIDLARHMLELAETNVRAAGLSTRIRLEQLDAKATGLASGSFSVVMSNSLVHHVPDPRPLFVELRRLVAPGGLVFVRDLLRPEDDRTRVDLVDRYAAVDLRLVAAETVTRAARQRALFDASLRAALSQGEVVDFAASAGLHGASVTRSSDRHFTLVYRAP